MGTDALVLPLLALCLSVYVLDSWKSLNSFWKFISVDCSFISSDLYPEQHVLINSTTLKRENGWLVHLRLTGNAIFTRGIGLKRSWIVVAFCGVWRLK